MDLSSTAMQPAKAKKVGVLLHGAMSDAELYSLGAHPHNPMCSQLFDALKGNDSVTSVDLSGNNIGDEGAQASARVGLHGMAVNARLMQPSGLRRPSLQCWERMACQLSLNWTCGTTR